MEKLKPCGHRLTDYHFAIIRKRARQWKLKEAEALRRIIQEAGRSTPQVKVERVYERS